MSEKILLNTKTCVLHITTGEASFFVVLKYRQQLNVLMSRYQTISFFVKYIINVNKNSMIRSSTLYLILIECFFFSLHKPCSQASWWLYRKEGNRSFQMSVEQRRRIKCNGGKVTEMTVCDLYVRVRYFRTRDGNILILTF